MRLLVIFSDKAECSCSFTLCGIKFDPFCILGDRLTFSRRVHSWLLMLQPHRRWTNIRDVDAAVCLDMVPVGEGGRKTRSHRLLFKIRILSSFFLAGISSMDFFRLNNISDLAYTE